MFDFIIKFISELNPEIKVLAVYIIGFIFFNFIGSLLFGEEEDILDIGCFCLFWPLILPFALIIVFIYFPGWLGEAVRNYCKKKKEEKEKWSDI